METGEIINPESYFVATKSIINMVWRFSILDMDIFDMSCDNSIFNISRSIFRVGEPFM